MQRKKNSRNELRQEISERFHWFPFNEYKGWTVLIAVAVVGVFLIGMFLWFVLTLLFRWHFQFSIRSLLVLAIAVAMPFSWLAVEMKRAREQEVVVEALRKMGGKVLCDYQIDEWGPDNSSQVWMYKMFGSDFCGEACSVLLDGTKVNNDDLRCLQKLKQVRIVFLGSTIITDAGLKRLNGLNQLTYVNLRGAHVTDAGVADLQKALPNCKIEH